MVMKDETGITKQQSEWMEALWSGKYKITSASGDTKEGCTRENTKKEEQEEEEEEEED